MKKRLIAMMLAGVMSAAMLTACGGGDTEATAPETEEVTEETTEETAEETTEEAAEDTAESDITFEDLQNNYAILTDVYQKVEDLYMSEAIAQDSEIEDLLTQAKSLIDEMGEATEDQFATQEDLQNMNDAMATVIDSLSLIVDGMQESDAGSAESAEANTDVNYVDGFYANDGNGHDFMIAFYEGASGDVAYVNDGTDEVFAEYEVEKAQLDDGTEYLLVTVGNTQLGYIEDGDDIYIVDADGTTYAAGRLSEEEADELANTANSN